MSDGYKTFTENMKYAHEWVESSFKSLFLLHSVGRDRLMSLISMYDALGLESDSRRVKILLPVLDEFDRNVSSYNDDSLK